MKKVSIFLFALMCASVVFGQQQKVAVYVTGGKDPGINKVLGDQLVAAFTNSGKYVAIERTSSFLAELGKEQTYQRTGAVDDNELSRLGKQFGVQLVCVAEVSEVASFDSKNLFGKSNTTNNKYVSARLIDVESAEVINTSNASGSLGNMKELLKVSQSITKELTGKTGKEAAAEKAAINTEKEAKAAAEKAEKEAKADEEKKKTDFRNAGYSPVGNLYILNKPSSTIKWEIAKQMCESSTIGGYNNWRLPTIGELMQIYALRQELFVNYGFDKASFEREEIWSSNTGKKDSHIILIKGRSDESKKSAKCHCVRDIK
jgi:hypothetical protein